MQKTVLILALGDLYWTRFAINFAERLVSDPNIKLAIVLESRLGEYQSQLRRVPYKNASVYYLTDFSAEYGEPHQEGTDATYVMGDYLRMYLLGQKRSLNKINWNRTASVVDKFVKSIFLKEKISLIIGDTVSTSLSYKFNQVAAGYNIPYWGLTGSRLPGRFATSYTVSEEADVVLKEYNSIQSGEVPMSDDEIDWAKEYLNTIDGQVPDYMKSPVLNSASLNKFINVRYLKAAIGVIIYSLVESKDAKNLLIRAHPLINVLTVFSRNVKRKFKSKIITNFYFRKEALPDEKPYFIYPIHYQPEASTVIGSPFYCDQLQLIRNLAFSMPPGHLLYVKEHLSNYGFPSIKTYREICSLPNVALIDHRADIKALIRKSKGVITLTSTAGFEALLLDKPVYHFGDVFYTYHADAKRIGDWSRIKDILSEVRPSLNMNKHAFLVAYRRYTHEGKLDFTKPDFGVTDVLINKINSFLLCEKFGHQKVEAAIVE